MISLVAKRVIELVGDESFLDEVREKGKVLKEGLMAIKGEYPGIVKDVRGRGLIQAVEFESPIPELGKEFLARGVLVITPGEKLLRCLPPLIITREEIEEFLNCVREVIKNSQSLPPEA